MTACCRFPSVLACDKLKLRQERDVYGIRFAEKTAPIGAAYWQETLGRFTHIAPTGARYAIIARAIDMPRLGRCGLKAAVVSAHQGQQYSAKQPELSCRSTK